MRSIPLRVACVLVTLSLASVAHAQSPAHLWSRHITGGNFELGLNLAVEATGPIIMVGYFDNSIDLGGGALLTAGSNDMFIAKYSASGAHQWSQRFGGTNSDQASCVAVDGSGHIVMGGTFSGSASFGGANLVSAGGSDIVLARYSPAGVHLWSQRFGGISSDSPVAIDIDGSGNIVVTGFFSQTINFGGGNIVSAGSADWYVAKFNSSGVHQWSRGSGSIGNEEGKGVGFDTAGNVFVTGAFDLTVDFGGGGLTSAGSRDVFLAKYDVNGVHQWSQRFGSTSGDNGSSLAVDAQNNVVVAGQFIGSVDFGGGALVGAGFTDVFLAKYDGAGAHQWSRRYGSTGSETLNRIALDAAGRIAAAGYFTGTGDFGDGNVVSAGAEDVFVARYGADGTHRWSQTFGNTSGDRGNAVGVDGVGRVVTCGFFNGTVDFGGGPFTSPSFDTFLAKYYDAAESPDIQSIADIGNDQGRHVRILFARSGHDDAESLIDVSRYDVFRRIDTLPAVAPADGSQPLIAGWEFVGSLPAYREEVYNIVAPTLADSTIADGMHYSAFFVRAGTADQDTYFDSPPDSGYSLDNLSPAIPNGLVYNSGELDWLESSAADFDYFTVYGSNTDSFASASLIDYTVASGLDVNASPYVYYFVTATDFSGNEGRPAKINTLSGVGDGPRSYVLSVSAYPNPFNPQTTVRYTIPMRGRVVVTIYDAAGAHVRTLTDDDLDAGAYSTTWDGRADRGNAVSSGVYFARIHHAGATRSYKMVLLR